MNDKKTIAAALAALMLALAFCGCAVVGLEPAAEEPAPAAEEDGQNPVMNLIGPYACDRASMLVEALGADEAKITVEWGSSAWEHSEWEMTGKFDEETMTVRYEDCVRKDVTYSENGESFTETVVYENGTGTIRFLDGSKIEWDDETEHAADGMTFEWSF